jgi:chorismate-pyruvate lyase
LRPSVPDLTALWRLFSPDWADVPQYRFVESSAVPEPYFTLLCHDHHMTVTLEKYHGGPVELHKLAIKHEGDIYARKLLLTRQGTHDVVMFGIVRIDLSWCSAQVREEIVAAKTPLGRILIQHDVLRRVAFHRCAYFPGGGELERRIALPTYGRLATIYCNDRPSIELLEIIPRIDT